MRRTRCTASSRKPPEKKMHAEVVPYRKRNRILLGHKKVRKGVFKSVRRQNAIDYAR
jgi:hypothetical protein